MCVCVCVCVFTFSIAFLLCAEAFQNYSSILNSINNSTIIFYCKKIVKSFYVTP